MQYDKYLKSTHWQNIRMKKLDAGRFCNICQSVDNLHIHHRRYSIGNKEATNSKKRGLNIKAGSTLGREKLCDLIVLCGSCHRLWHAHFDKRYLTNHKASQISELIKYGVIKKQAFIITKNFNLYNLILTEAKKRTL